MGSNDSDDRIVKLKGSLQRYNPKRAAETGARIINSFREFFADEWEAFKEEQKTSFQDKEFYPTKLDFDALTEEWTYTPENLNHWENQKKNEGGTFSPLFYSIVIGFVFTVIPNGAIVLDIWAAFQYLFGMWYTHKSADPVHLNVTCREVSSSWWVWSPIANATNPENSSLQGSKECFETDPIYGIQMLVILFLPGIFWSLGIFIQWVNYLRKNDEGDEDYDQSRRLFFYFIPLAAFAIITFPFQLMIISLISCFNSQDHWMTLVTKVQIADGIFNAHLQYILQLYIFFSRSDRYASLFQYGAAFGSLLLLVYSRIESLLLGRGGHRLSLGQKAWWACRFGPMFLFNSIFKLGSISLILAMLQFNAIWLYGGVFVMWLFLHLLFNEKCLPRRFYYLFTGAGLHAVSVDRVPVSVF